MTTFQQFRQQCKTRHDFSDMIQVRYTHHNGQTFDTWVSGDEVLQRLRSEAAEKRLKGLSRLDWQEVREAGRQLPEEGKKRAKRGLRDRLAEGLEDALGDNVIGDSLSAAVSGRDADENPEAEERERWRALLADDVFRAVVLELAWIQLEGSFPEDSAEEPDDWL